MFQYLKYLLIILTIIYIMRSKKIYNYVSWLFLFVLLLLDDSLQFHERFGRWAVDRFNYTSMFGLRPQDLGELTYIAVFGPILLLFWYSDIIMEIKKLEKLILILVCFLPYFFFGVVVDMLHILVPDNRYIKLFMLVLEDGGEMITLSFMTWYFFFLTMKSDNHNTYLYQYLIKKRKYFNRLILKIKGLIHFEKNFYNSYRTLWSNKIFLPELKTSMKLLNSFQNQ